MSLFNVSARKTHRENTASMAQLPIMFGGDPPQNSPFHLMQIVFLIHMFVSFMFKEYVHAGEDVNALMVSTQSLLSTPINLNILFLSSFSILVLFFLHDCRFIFNSASCLCVLKKTRRIYNFLDPALLGNQPNYCTIIIRECVCTSFPLTFAKK